MLITKFDQKEADELRKTYNHELDIREDIMKNAHFKVDVFGDVINKDKFSQEQITKLNNFSTKNNMKINFSIKINLIKPRKKKKIDYQPRALPYYDQIINI